MINIALIILLVKGLLRNEANGKGKASLLPE